MTKGIKYHERPDEKTCFSLLHSTIPIIPLSVLILSLYPSSVVQPGLCQIWSETQNTGTPITRLISRDFVNPKFTNHANMLV